jgi:hypothetical protein
MLFRILLRCLVALATLGLVGCGYTAPIRD